MRLIGEKHAASELIGWQQGPEPPRFVLQVADDGLQAAVAADVRDHAVETLVLLVEELGQLKGLGCAAKLAVATLRLQVGRLELPHVLVGPCLGCELGG
jgi:hypothetical protein